MQTWHHWVFALIIGYLIGYYFRGIGNATAGRLVPSTGAM